MMMMMTTENEEDTNEMVLFFRLFFMLMTMRMRRGTKLHEKEQFDRITVVFPSSGKKKNLKRLKWKMKRWEKGSSTQLSLVLLMHYMLLMWYLLLLILFWEFHHHRYQYLKNPPIHITTKINTKNISCFFLSAPLKKCKNASW